ncbi:mannitol dehydrogenase family protein [Myceligenerans pegani]|uniref:Mannitol-1-phosphate 5-dehydrogenase n=1 Tax=Myceligenerans pegani TaxID=2776917 RepID=A0ABR9N653_9MICO|nr:mannitol dehydrogenase family protein [Myceligenerans sp. TRM 65318]MBE1878756.1 mannitol dehydrogenase family protein [Myceligenerans sp. TRM 65318]MBE3021027.1 mannitol dehydrogenase family protein [Myceligenerans sp. TRM 65318]
MTDRLRRDALPEGVAAPVNPERVGIVHLGIGAFHRAHQAVYTERAMSATGDLGWGILGVTQRSATVRDQLRPQGGVYGVLTAGATASSHGLVVGDDLRLDLVGAVVDVAYPAEETARVLAAVAAPTTHVVTLTITEKGYARLPGGGLDVGRVRADLDALAAESSMPGASPAPASSAIGLLVRGLAARHRAGDAPLTVLTCDNMVDNGHVLERLVREAVDAALPGSEGDDLRAYLDSRVAFPCSMVDRIAPATTPGQRDAVERALGVRDEGLVVGEPFAQWVVEDRFAGPRPAWEHAGATLTSDVAPYEQAKLRLLNGTHSLIAYAGALAGHATIAEAVADPHIAGHARTYLFEDALPTLSPPDGADLRAYGEEILRRFANPHTGHTTIQVAMDGTQKIPFRWGGVLADRLEAGRVPQGVSFALASWARFVHRRTLAARGQGADVPGGSCDGVDDPRAEELAALVGGSDMATSGAGAAGAPAPEEVRRLIELPGLLPATNEALVEAVLEAAADR